MRYAVAMPAQNASTAGEPIGVLWNPSGSVNIRVRKIEVMGGTAMRLSVIRTSTRGTRGTVTTPDGDNAFTRTTAVPPSGTELDRGDYTVNPTFATNPLLRGQVSGQNGCQIGWWLEQPIVVGPGRGLAVVTDTTHTAMSLAFEWDE
jgi:hypothetical protein